MTQKRKDEADSKGMTQARIATAVTTSAMSLSLMGTLPTPVQAQDQSQQLAAAINDELTDEQAANKFWDFGYNYCDAMVMAAFWKQEQPYEAKVTIGHKLWHLGQEQTEIVLREGRAEALKKADDRLPTYYDDGGYSYEDAELLAEYWGTEDVYESKITMSRLLIGGHEKVLKSALDSARR